VTALNGVVISVRCHYCSKQKPPREIAKIPGNIRICSYCWDQHLRLMQMIANGGLPDHCQECGPGAGNEVDEHLFLVDKDGIKQVLCQTCMDRYARKRMDLFGPTKYGQEVDRGH